MRFSAYDISIDYPQVKLSNLIRDLEKFQDEQASNEATSEVVQESEVQHQECCKTCKRS